MFFSLKRLVIVLGVVIIALTTIVISTLIKKINSKIINDNYITDNEIFKIEKNFTINSFDIKNGNIFFHLTSENHELLRIYDLKNGKMIREYELK